MKCHSENRSSSRMASMLSHANGQNRFITTALESLGSGICISTASYYYAAQSFCHRLHSARSNLQPAAKDFAPVEFLNQQLILIRTDSNFELLFACCPAGDGFPNPEGGSDEKMKVSDHQTMAARLLVFAPNSALNLFLSRALSWADANVFLVETKLFRKLSVEACLDRVASSADFKQPCTSFQPPKSTVAKAKTANDVEKLMHGCLMDRSVAFSPTLQFTCKRRAALHA